MRCSMYWRYHENVVRSKFGEKQQNKKSCFSPGVPGSPLLVPRYLTSTPGAFQLRSGSRKAQNLKNLPFKKPRKKTYQAPSTWSSSDTQGFSSTDNSASNASSKATKYLLSFPQQKWGNLSHTLFVIVTVLWEFVGKVFLLTNFLCIFVGRVLGVSIRGEEKLHRNHRTYQ